MSNAEDNYVFNKELDKKILDLISAYISESPHSATGSAFQRSLYEILQAHTNQTLQELKAKLRGIERGTCMIHLGEAIEVIEDIQTT